MKKPTDSMPKIDIAPRAKGKSALAPYRLLINRHIPWGFPKDVSIFIMLLRGVPEPFAVSSFYENERLDISISSKAFAVSLTVSE